MAAPSNPFTELYTGIVDTVRGNANLIGNSALVKDRNLISWVTKDGVSTTHPEKSSKTTADYPELTLSMVGMEGNLRGNSSTLVLSPLFEWECRTDVHRADYDIYPITFELIRSLNTFMQTVASTLTYASKPFISRCTLKGAGVVPNLEGVKGFTSALVFSVDIGLSPADMTHTIV